MKPLTGYMHGIGIGGWLTNYKRIAVLPPEARRIISPGDIEHFETYITHEDVKRITSFGMDHIRLCFDQIVMEDSDHPGTYRESGLRCLDRFIEWCRLEGINVILNLHKAIGAYCDCRDENMLLTDPELQDRFIALWETLERRYHASAAPFEILNEIAVPDSAEWNTLAAKTIAALRRLNPTRKIIIGGIGYNSPDSLRDLRLFDDANIIYTIHFYGPHEFTHQRGILQVHPAIYNRAMPYPGDIERYRDYHRFMFKNEHAYEQYDRMDRRYIEDALRPAMEFMAEHPDKQLYFGEFGTIRHADIRSRENWMRDVIGIAKREGWAYSVWNYLSTPYDGNRFSLVDDDTREILSPELLKIISP